MLFVAIIERLRVTKRVARYATSCDMYQKYLFYSTTFNLVCVSFHAIIFCIRLFLPYFRVGDIPRKDRGMQDAQP